MAQTSSGNVIPQSILILVCQRGNCFNGDRVQDGLSRQMDMRKAAYQRLTDVPLFHNETTGEVEMLN